VSANDYSRGLAKANKGIKLLQKLFGPKKSRQVADRNHDRADGKMYRAMANNDEKTADFNRGQAMGYGMYAHTGTKLNK
jgi:hypothetical protein